MGIIIDDLDPTVLQSRAHELPAMHEGNTVKLTVAQILGLLAKSDFISKFGASDVAFTPTGSIAASTMQAALAEVDSEKLALAGGTMTGDLSLGGKKLSNGLILDGDVRIANTTDATKKLAFDASSIATGTTRTLKVPDANVTISSFAATLVDDTDGAAMWATLGATQSLGSNQVSGYQKLPSGLMVQWGTTSVTTSSEVATVTYPVVFPNNFYTVLVCNGDTNNAPAATFGVHGTPSLSSFNLRTNGVSGSVRANWVAFGR